MPPKARHRGRFVVSLDFELTWGVRDRPQLESYEANLRGSREVIPRLLELFDRFGIRATWATVGMLFADGRAELDDVIPQARPRYWKARLDPYPDLATAGATEAADPLHFAPSLIDRIHRTPGQEIGTHTFSHFYALEPERDADAFAADLDAAIILAERRGIAVTSIVFPRNQVPHDWLEICRSRGLTAFRGTERSRLYDPAPERFRRVLRRAMRLADAYVPVGSPHLAPVPGPAAGGLADVPSSRFLRPYDPRLRALEPLRLRRVTRAMSVAARRGLVFHLWWHPHNFGVHQAENLAFLTSILEHYAELEAEFGMLSQSMGDLAAEARAEEEGV